jgi:hypothetical protein
LIFEEVKEVRFLKKYKNNGYVLSRSKKLDKKHRACMIGNIKIIKHNYKQFSIKII